MNGPTSTGLDARLANVLCYAGWWVTGLVFLFAERQHRGVRFHAAQATVVFGAVSVVLLGLGGASAVALVLRGSLFRALQATANLVWLAAVLLWVALLVRTFRGDTWRLPVAADVADRLAG